MKLYAFECRAHPEAGGNGQLAGVVKFEVAFAFEGDVTQTLTARCPICGGESGVFGPWREVKPDTQAVEYQSKWLTAVSVWEKVATEAGALRRKLSEASAELLSLKTALALPAKPSEGIN